MSRCHFLLFVDGEYFCSEDKVLRMKDGGCSVYQ